MDLLERQIAAASIAADQWVETLVAIADDLSATPARLGEDLNVVVGTEPALAAAAAVNGDVRVLLTCDGRWYQVVRVAGPVGWRNLYGTDPGPPAGPALRNTVGLS